MLMYIKILTYDIQNYNIIVIAYDFTLTPFSIIPSDLLEFSFNLIILP